MEQNRKGIYHALTILPDVLYPFKTEIEGQWVRGIRSYNVALARIEERYGVGHYGYKLVIYRELFHFVGSILLLLVAAFLSRYFFGSEDAMYVILVCAVLLISFQEFYLHRRMYQQLWRKGVVDWLAWCLPIGVYLFTHFH